MKITDSTLQSQSSASSYTRNTREMTLDASLSRTPPQESSNASNQTFSSVVALSDEALAISQQAQEFSGLDPKLELLIGLIERLTGHRIKLFDTAELSAGSSAQPQDLRPQAQAERDTGNLEWSVRVESRTVREEAEQASYQAKGTVRTSDGRQIAFEFGLVMEHYERTESSVSFSAGNAPKKKDPLVLNLSTDQAKLTGQSIRFDLNADGTSDQLAKLAAGSGYLVLDRNQNGKIDDGTELFGPLSGDGFSELSALDDDGNGWIDENDAAFSALAVWRPGETSQSLRTAGVGAIALENRATPFTLRANGTEVGSVRTTGVFLTEEGAAHSIQQIDLVA